MDESEDVSLTRGKHPWHVDRSGAASGVEAIFAVTIERSISVTSPTSVASSRQQVEGRRESEGYASRMEIEAPSNPS